MTFECQSCKQEFDTLADHTVHLRKCERKEVIMEAIVVTMELWKETKNTYRYEALDNSVYVSSLYVHRTAMQGQAPKKITVTVMEAE